MRMHLALIWCVGCTPDPFKSPDDRDRPGIPVPEGADVEPDDTAGDSAGGDGGDDGGGDGGGDGSDGGDDTGEDTGDPPIERERLLSAADAVFLRTDERDRVGGVVRVAGDLDGDGVDELVLAA